jgi:pimeloyl-ACP methyl ester carboxylesterase
MAAMALWNTYRARKVEREHPSRGRFVTADGARLHYLEKGRGRPVALLHCNVVAAENFEFERPVVVGHSWGTLVALALSLDYPDAVSGLVLLSDYHHPTLRADVPLFSLPAIPVIGDLIRYTVGPLFGAALLPLAAKGMFSPLPVPERFAKGLPYGLPLRPSQIRAEAQDTATMVSAVRAMQRRERELQMPVVIMAGTDDRVVDHRRQSIPVHQEIPQSVLRLVPSVGQMLHYAVPEQVVEATDASANSPTTLRNAAGEVEPLHTASLETVA